jgi:hypothetical protein
MFNSNITDGLREELSDGFPHTLAVVTPPASCSNFTSWQVAEIGLPQAVKASAVIIAPCADEEEIWTGLLRLMAHGVAVVVMDLEPNERFFLDRNVSGTRFRGVGLSRWWEACREVHCRQASRGY